MGIEFYQIELNWIASPELILLSKVAKVVDTAKIQRKYWSIYKKSQ